MKGRPGLKCEDAHLVEIVKLKSGRRLVDVNKNEIVSKLTSSGLTTPLMSVLPFKCFPGPMRIACKFSSLLCCIRRLASRPTDKHYSRHFVENRLARAFTIFFASLNAKFQPRMQNVGSAPT